MAKNCIVDVKRVKELEGSDEEGVKRRLDAGWILLHVYSVGEPSQDPAYVLGWTKDEEPPEDPSEEFTRVVREQ